MMYFGQLLYFHAHTIDICKCLGSKRALNMKVLMIKRFQRPLILDETSLTAKMEIGRRA